nr:hypothetical protein [Bradyrhizobium zhanjiangense]
MRLADALSALCSLAAQISQSQDTVAQFSLSHGWTLGLVELSDLLVGLAANGVSWRRQNSQLLAATAAVRALVYATGRMRKTRIDVVGDMVAWGAHFCFFYETREDLLVGPENYSLELDRAIWTPSSKSASANGFTRYPTIPAFRARERSSSLG